MISESVATVVQELVSVLRCITSVPLLPTLIRSPLLVRTAQNLKGTSNFPSATTIFVLLPIVE